MVFSASDVVLAVLVLRKLQGGMPYALRRRICRQIYCAFAAGKGWGESKGAHRCGVPPVRLLYVFCQLSVSFTVCTSLLFGPTIISKSPGSLTNWRSAL